MLTYIATTFRKATRAKADRMPKKKQFGVDNLLTDNLCERMEGVRQVAVVSTRNDRAPIKLEIQL